MQIVLNSKKTLLVTSLGLCVLGTLFAALKIYYKSKNKKKQSNQGNKGSKSRSTSSNKSLVGGSSSASSSRLSRPNSIVFDPSLTNNANNKLQNSNHSRKSSKTSLGSINRKERLILMNAAAQDNVKNIPGEELLELGLNYLNQAIKSWETALDSIESAAYMQSSTLALPNDEHADLVHKLRCLLDGANNINLSCQTKLIKSSQTLQIIQSRLAYKQQLYSDALLKNNKLNRDDISDDNNNNNNYFKDTVNELDEDYENNDQNYASPSGSYIPKFGYLSEDDNESFVSADSDVDWLDEELFKKIENMNGKNVLYEMAVSNVSLGRVGYRVSRRELLNCSSEDDFAAKLHVIRLGFDRLLQNDDKKEWMTGEGRRLLSFFMTKADKDTSGVQKTYDEMIKFVMNENNWKAIKDELATRDVNYINFYDIALDFILLDAFEDLESPPSAITAVIQNRWLSQSFKETALSTAVWSVLKAKRKLLKYPNGFISRFYSINEYLVPVLAWGFLGTDENLTKSCTYIKNQVIEYLRCLFDPTRTRYTNLDELVVDIESHTIKYLEEIYQNN